MESEMKSVVVSQPLEYEQKSYSHPYYKMLRINPLQGTQSLTLNASRQSIQIELPASECFNLSRSYLQMTLNVDAQGSSPAFGRIFNDTLPISSINLRTRSGVVLCELDFLAQYVRIANRIKTRIAHYITDGDRDLLTPSKDLAITSGGQAVTSSVRPDGSLPSFGFLEPVYIQTSTDAQASVKYYSIPLNVISETIFELDKDLWFGETLLMTLNVSPLAEIVYRTEGAGSVANAPQTNAKAPIGSTNRLSDIILYLAVEQNVVIKKQVMDLVQAGKFKMILPYVHYYLNPRNSSGNNSVSLRFNRGHGEYLRSILHIPVNGGATSNTVYDSSNVNGAKITRYFTTTQNMRDQDFDALCNDVDTSLASSAWTLIRDKIRGTVAGLNENSYFYNFFILSDYSELGSEDDIARLNTPKWNLQCGRSLENEVKWDLIATHANANLINHYSFARVSKTMQVLPNLVVVT